MQNKKKYEFPFFYSIKCTNFGTDFIRKEIYFEIEALNCQIQVYNLNDT